MRGKKTSAVRYTVVYSRCRDGGTQAYFPAFPEITVWYPTQRECRKAAPEALAIHLEGLRALGEKVPDDVEVVQDHVSLPA
jgi:predicted RNase H-like HicB family nuclease